MFKKGDRVKVINDKILPGNDYGPLIKVGQEFIITDIFLDSQENQHIDVGLRSVLNYVRSYETKEELPNGKMIHWAHPTRFEKIE